MLKRARGRELIAAIDAVANGETLDDPGVQARACEHVRRLTDRDMPDQLGSLTSQELRILDLLAEGMSNRGIAQSMQLSDKTVKNYVSTVLAKLHLQRRTQAAAFVAHHRGWLLSPRLPATCDDEDAACTAGGVRGGCVEVPTPGPQWVTTTVA